LGRAPPHQVEKKGKPGRKPKRNAGMGALKCQYLQVKEEKCFWSTVKSSIKGQKESMTAGVKKKGGRAWGI